MKKLLIGLMVLGSVSAFAKKYPCTDYLKSQADKLEDKGDVAIGVGTATAMATLGFAAPLTIPSAIIVENVFVEKAKLVRDLTISLDQASFSEEQWKESIIRNNAISIKSIRSERLKSINEKRLKDVLPLMTQQEFEEKYPLNEETSLNFKTNFKSLSINQFLAKLEKVSKEAITYEQLRDFLLIERETNYFCQSKESIKLSKQRLIEIANDVLRH